MLSRKTITLCVLLLCTTFATADDWPQWRGSHRDAVLSAAEQIETLPEKPVPKWSVAIGAGYSGPTIADGRVYVTDRGPADIETEVERILCFDAETGKAIWSHQYESTYTVSYRAGPRAAVTVDAGRAYAVGAMGHFHCLDAATGEVIWKRDLQSDYAIRMPIWGITASPLIYKDMVIQIAAGKGDACVVAMDVATGKERWHSLDERAGYSAPIVIQQGGQDVVVCWTGESVSGLNPADGSVFWSIPMLPRNMPIGVPTPIVQDDLLFVSSFYDGSMLIQFDKTKPAAKKLWHRVGVDEKNTDALHCMISNPVFRGDHIYGADSYGEFRCLDIKTGDRVWEDLSVVKRNRWGTVYIIQNGSREIIQNENGELMSATLSPQGIEIHSRAKFIKPTRKQLNRRGGVVWAHPAIADGHLYARTDSELICLPLK
ncbi:PQQ-binding-like beta-propeller repeat protein [Stieleria marina]|uniref:Outer membrane biogenesis protein BamB n=1 Tax=Stieleria marina TaxID=1930275 RepID=A0A517P0Q4_9BACT|nr:outer membrane biogenesis protein BamB [Planctomycetes bacterium K23_9]